MLPAPNQNQEGKNIGGFQRQGIALAQQKGELNKEQVQRINSILNNLQDIRQRETNRLNEVNVHSFHTMKCQCEGCAGNRGCCGSFKKIDVLSYINASNKAPEIFFKEDRALLEKRKELIEKERKKLEEIQKEKMLQIENKAIDVFLSLNQTGKNQTLNKEDGTILEKRKQSDFSFTIQETRMKTKEYRDSSLGQIPVYKVNKNSQKDIIDGEKKKEIQFRLIQLIKEANRIIQKPKITQEDKKRFLIITNNLKKISNNELINLKNHLQRKIQEYKKQLQQKEQKEKKKNKEEKLKLNQNTQKNQNNEKKINKKENKKKEKIKKEEIKKEEKKQKKQLTIMEMKKIEKPINKEKNLKKIKEKDQIKKKENKDVKKEGFELSQKNRKLIKIIKNWILKKEEVEDKKITKKRSNLRNKIKKIYNIQLNGKKRKEKRKMVA
ncbi:MAG: hypothetical protein ACK4J0_00320 [Candidatus Anstonellaceae archaeon]